jgi:hypothetical protein
LESLNERSHASPFKLRNARLLARAAALQQRTSGFEPAASASVLVLIEAKLAHETRRSALPAARLLRVVPIVRGWRAGAGACKTCCEIWRSRSDGDLEGLRAD